MWSLLTVLLVHVPVPSMTVLRAAGLNGATKNWHPPLSFVHVRQGQQQHSLENADSGSLVPISTSNTFGNFVAHLLARATLKTKDNDGRQENALDLLKQEVRSLGIRISILEEPKIQVIGGSCTETAQCPSNAHCSSGICVCDSNYVASSNNQKCLQIQVIGGSCTETAQCPSNAHCSSGLCVCDSNYVASSNNQKCLQKRSHGQTCEEEVQCPSDQHCSSGVCACNLPSSPPTCHAGYIASGNGCYTLESKNTWDGSRDDCQDHNGYLAELETECEFIAVQAALRPFLPPCADLPPGSPFSPHIGGIKGVDNVWRWDHSGRNVDYLNWCPGQPTTGTILQMACSSECNLFYGVSDPTSLRYPLCESDPI